MGKPNEGGRVVRKVLIVDDDPMILRAWARSCRTVGKIPLCASSRREALDLATREEPEMAVIDLLMPHVAGLVILRDLEELGIDMFKILVSGAMCADYAMQGVAAGADDCRDKRDSTARLIELVESGDRSPPDLGRLPTLKQIEWEY